MSDTSTQRRLRLKADGRMVEILPDGREREMLPVDPAVRPAEPVASGRSQLQARLAAMTPPAPAAPAAPSRLAARLAHLAPPVPRREPGETESPGSAGDAAYARRVRAATGLTQAEFSARIGVPIETVRNWEQGKRSPRGPARALLRVIEKAPALAFAALAPEAR